MMRQMFIRALYLCDCLSGSVSCCTGLGLNWTWLCFWVSSSERKAVWLVQKIISAHLGTSENKVSDWGNPGDELIKGGLVVRGGKIVN